MQREPTCRGERLLDGRAREVVPERHAAVHDMEDAAREALVHRIGGLAADREEQRCVERRWSDRRRLHDGRCLRAELRDSGQYQVAHRVRYLLDSVREELGHVERVPRREAPDDIEVADSAACRVENAARDALVDSVDRLAAHDEQERRIERGRRDRRRLDDSSRLWAELRDPRQHDVPDRAGYLLRPVSQELLDVERVARREPPDGVDVDVAALDEPGDAVAGEWPDCEPLDRGRGREISESDAERMIARPSSSSR